MLVIREKLADLYESEEQWSKAAQMLSGIDLDSGMRSESKILFYFFFLYVYSHNNGSIPQFFGIILILIICILLWHLYQSDWRHIQVIKMCANSSPVSRGIDILQLNIIPRLRVSNMWLWPLTQVLCFSITLGPTVVASHQSENTL